MDGADAGRFGVERRLRGFRVRTLALGPGDAHEYRPAEWADALVIVERGELEVECRSGMRARFREGAVLAFAGLPLQRLRNAGSGPLVLRAFARAVAAD